MEGRCERHQFDQAIDRCGRCGLEYCSTCLIYAFGAKKAPFCLPCAGEAAGVRAGAGPSRHINRRERKQLERQRRAARNASEAAAPTVPESYDMNWMGAAVSGPH